MKIAVAALHLNTKGGTQRQALALSLAFQELGYDVTIYTLIADYKNCYGEMMKKLKIVLVSTAPRQTSGNLFWRKWMSKKYFEAAAYSVAQSIFADTEFLSCQDEESYKVAYYFKRLHPKSTIKSLWTMNDPPISYRPKESWFFDTGRRIFNIFELIYERPFLKKTDSILVLDNRNQKLVRTYYGRNAVIVGSGVDYNYFYHPVRKEVQDPVILLGIGIFAPYRRFEDIIDAAAILKSEGYRLIVKIAGAYSDDSDYVRELKVLIKTKGVDREVVFLGRVSENELLNLYRTSDIFIFPNHMQTFGLAPAEAMATGLPVIISRTAGFSDFVNNGIEAFVVNPLSPKEIAKCAAHWINDSNLRFQMATAGQEFVKKNIDWKIRATHMLKIAGFC